MTHLTLLVTDAMLWHLTNWHVKNRITSFIFLLFLFYFSNHGPLSKWTCPKQFWKFFSYAKTVFFLFYCSCNHAINPLLGTGNYHVTLNNMKLVHWPLMGGLLHLVQQGENWVGPQPARAPPRCTTCNSPHQWPVYQSLYGCVMVRWCGVVMCPLKGKGLSVSWWHLSFTLSLYIWSCTLFLPCWWLIF